jgi:hypothetical protein
LSTISEIFQGDPGIFSGLKIMDSRYEFKKHPVINLDMSMDSGNPEELKTSLYKRLNRVALREGFELEKSNPSEILIDLIDELYNRYDKTGVVVLIDEYDHPVSSHLNKLELASDNTEILRTFYSSFKTAAQAGMLHFVLVTGVTRYAMLGISAGLNNLHDISFNSDYASICGFTCDELDQYFSDFFPSALKKAIASTDLPPGSTAEDLCSSLLSFYDGYSWDGQTRVLNPFSLVNFFENAQFFRFWSDTAPSLSLLTSVISEAPANFLPGEPHSLKARSCKVSSVGQPPTLASLFHTGYLTLEAVTGPTKNQNFYFRLPNDEVRDDVFRVVADILFAKKVKDIGSEAAAISSAIAQRDASNLTASLNAFYSGLVHRRHADNESFYHSLLWAYFKGLFKEVNMEESGAIGDLDLTLKMGNGLYAVIELKYGCDEINVEHALNRLAQNALETIYAKQYGQKYRIPGNTVIDIGLGVFGRGQVKAIFGASEDQAG